MGVGIRNSPVPPADELKVKRLPWPSVPRGSPVESGTCNLMKSFTNPYLNQAAQKPIRRNNANPFHEPVHARFLDYLITMWNAEFFLVIMKMG
jgi:hypothetical protein